MLMYLKPYVAEHSRSIYARLGARVAFFGIDARTEVCFAMIKLAKLTFSAYSKASQLSRDLPNNILSLALRA